MTVGEDYTRTPTVGVPVKEVLTLFLARSGALRDDNIKLLQACFTDAMADGEGKDALEGRDRPRLRVDGPGGRHPRHPPPKGPVTTKLAVAEVVAVQVGRVTYRPGRHPMGM